MAADYQLTLDQIRMVDRVAIEQFGMIGLVLMENAGRGAADFIASQLRPASRCLVLCGTGNNGGDGMVIARHLHANGIEVKVLVTGNRNKVSHDFAVNFGILERTNVTIQWAEYPLDDENNLPALIHQYGRWFDEADAIVDALLGTGAKGSPRGGAACLIHAANSSGAKKYAIDIPSGLDPETGEMGQATFIADYTLTFVAEKPGFRNQIAKNTLGQVFVLPIGIPPEVIDMVVGNQIDSPAS